MRTDLPDTMVEDPASANLPGLSRPWRCDKAFLTLMCRQHGTEYVASALRSSWGGAMEVLAAAWQLWDDDLLRLQREIADDGAVFTIEAFARRAANHPPGVWDVSAPDEREIRDESIDQVQQDIQRAVRYLELRGKIVRPIAGQPQYVSFGSA